LNATSPPSSPHPAPPTDPATLPLFLPQAKAALRELEDTKLAGMDYPLSTLLALRTLCQVSWTGNGAGGQVGFPSGQ
jgi:hypothetical protein